MFQSAQDVLIEERHNGSILKLSKVLVDQVPLHVARSWDIRIVGAVERTGSFSIPSPNRTTNQWPQHRHCSMLWRKEHTLELAKRHCMFQTLDEFFPLVTMEPEREIPSLFQTIEEGTHAPGTQVPWHASNQEPSEVLMGWLLVGRRKRSPQGMASPS